MQVIHPYVLSLCDITCSSVIFHMTAHDSYANNAQEINANMRTKKSNRIRSVRS